ncbi:hypothetical protein EIP86_002270 [Pleurotus ostreatoroseus]|nr:hypothetical protein EIP86_002270 [Pleurotus ostreatoroseus]
MSAQPVSLKSVARNKLRDVASLYRWVLLKNSITSDAEPSLSTSAISQAEAGADAGFRHDEEDEAYEVVGHDYFSFPDPRSVHDEDDSSPPSNVENQWLDSLLENLEDDDDDDIAASSQDDAPETLSPLYSPMSSSDDLVDQSSFYPYPMPYPPVSSPAVPSWFELHASTSSSDSVSTSPSYLAPYDSPLPYYAVDELEDSPVPDAIEDTSDDESDALSTPSVASTSSLAHSPPSPLASPSTPPQRTRFLSQPQVYVETDDSYFYPFELDPLPFPDHHPDVADVANSVEPEPLGGVGLTAARPRSMSACWHRAIGDNATTHHDERTKQSLRYPPGSHRTGAVAGHETNPGRTLSTG